MSLNSIFTQVKILSKFILTKVLLLTAQDVYLGRR